MSGKTALRVNQVILVRRNRFGMADIIQEMAKNSKSSAEWARLRHDVKKPASAERARSAILPSHCGSRSCSARGQNPFLQRKDIIVSD